MDSIILLGFFGAGKTSIGKSLADRASFSFVELEDEVKKVSGIRSITEAYEKNLLRWRESEIAICRNLSQKQKMVIAGTSGFVENSINILYFRENCLRHRIVYLYTSLDVIRSRLRLTLERGTRPADRIVDKIAQHYVRREILYKYYAHSIIDTSSKSVDESVDEIYSRYFPKGK